MMQNSLIFAVIKKDQCDGPATVEAILDSIDAAKTLILQNILSSDLAHPDALAHYNPAQRFECIGEHMIYDQWLQTLIPEYTIHSWDVNGLQKEKLYCTFDAMFKHYIFENNIWTQGLNELWKTWKSDIPQFAFKWFSSQPCSWNA
jgi:hypothetical protein